jgi:serine/threonine-protein kinase RsbW
MIMGRFSIKLKNRAGDLQKIEQVLEKLGQRLGLTQKCKCETNLAMEELISNIIRYGYADQGEHSVKVTISHQTPTLTIRIEDDGAPFNPVEVKNPDLSGPAEKRRIGGLGVHLAKCFTDSIEYRRKGSKNIVILKKNIIKGCNQP